MNGRVYAVGVGPGDPELMTLKAVRLIREAEVIAVPGRVPEKSAAYRIAVQAVPELADKILLPVDMPMIRDREEIARRHHQTAKGLETYLREGKTVVYLTLGDPTVYCTFGYLRQILEADGFETELVSGIPSFCAAAARMHTELVSWDEQLHVIPGAVGGAECLEEPGTYVLMKSASRMKEVKQLLRESGRRVLAVENCGMEQEHIYRGVEQIPDDAGYFTLILAYQE